VIAISNDVRLVSGVVRAHRTWLAHNEIDLLYDFEQQILSGWCLTAHQRGTVDRLVQSARDRREVAVSLHESGPPSVS
jgi:hypothetical protein